MSKFILLGGLFLAGPATALGYADWLGTQPPILTTAILDHVSPPDALAGVIIASPERGTPGYYFHWVRDAALTMITVDEARHAGLISADHAERLFKDYASLSRTHQRTASHPGNAKFHVDSGRPYEGPWCQPQNDGPALRALALTNFAMEHLARRGDAYVRGYLYDNRLPADTVIKKDLEFIAHNWRDPSCDLWEETWGHHFYTRMVQRKALLEGARLADSLGDHSAADFYRAQARAMATELEKHWDPNIGLIRATLDVGEGVAKQDDLDTAVVLGLLHGHTDDGFFRFTDERVLTSVARMSAVFRDLYPVNSTGPGVAIGRYREDTWNKVRGVYGNPWYLLTAAFAQFYFRAAREAATVNGEYDHAERLFALGDGYLRRVHHHAAEGGYRLLDEQFDRHDGHMTSAPDLTWSYAETLEATLARARARAVLDAGASCVTNLVGAEAM